jgi:hypothetical protein
VPRPEIGQPVFDLSRESFADRGIKPASRHESTLIILLERYADYRAIPGVTFQIPVDTKTVDFRFPDLRLWWEHHPISRHEWKSSEASKRYGEMFRRMSMHDKRESWAIHKLEMADNYYRSRRELLNHFGYREEGLIHTISPADAYHQVFSRVFNVALSEREFLREWEKVIRSI